MVQSVIVQRKVGFKSIPDRYGYGENFDGGDGDACGGTDDGLQAKASEW